MLDPGYRWDSVQNVPSSATTKFRGPIYTATPYSEEIAIFNTLSSTRKRYDASPHLFTPHSDLCNHPDVVQPARDTTLHRTCLCHIPISAAPPPRMTSSFASDAPPTGRHRAWNFPYNGWILLSDSDQSEESRGLVGLSSARSSRFV